MRGFIGLKGLTGLKRLLQAGLVALCVVNFVLCNASKEIFETICNEKCKNSKETIIEIINDKSPELLRLDYKGYTKKTQ
ncbi:hypothetical protein [Helicobacter sp. T3_23-1059]